MDQRIPVTHNISRKRTRIYPGRPDWVREQSPMSKEAPEQPHLEGWALAVSRKDERS